MGIAKLCQAIFLKGNGRKCLQEDTKDSEIRKLDEIKNLKEIKKN